MAAVARRPANLLDKTYGAPVGYAYFDIFNTGSRLLRNYFYLFSIYINSAVWARNPKKVQCRQAAALYASKAKTNWFERVLEEYRKNFKKR